jgi:hypothetical protein
MRKSQVMVISSIAVVVILFIVIVLFSSYFKGMMQDGSDIKYYREDASNIGSLLLQPPFPSNWNETTIKRVGTVKDGVVQENLLDDYKNLSYSQTKKLLGIKRDYIFYFTNSSNTTADPFKIYGREFWGWNGLTKPNGGAPLSEVVTFILKYSNKIAKDERFVRINFDGEITEAKLVVYVWEFADGELNLDELSWINYEFSAFLHTTKIEYNLSEDIILSGAI